MGGSSGGSQPQQVTQTTATSSPWSGQQPYLTRGFEEAQQGILESPSEFFPGSTVVPYAPETEQALAMQTQRALGGSPINMAASQELQKTLGGDYLNQGNPAFQAMVERSVQPLRREYEETVRPGIQSQFSAAGRYGSPGGMGNQLDRAADSYMRQVGDISTGLAFPTYEAERTAQQRGLAFAPQQAAQDYQDISQLGAVGGAREALSGQQLGEQIARHNFGQQEEQARILQYLNAIQGNYGGTQTGTTTANPYSQGGNSALAGLGGAASGAALGSMFGPWGMAGGAVLGGGLGLFG